MNIQLRVAIGSVLVVFLFIMFSWVFDYIQNRPLVENGVTIIHGSVEGKGRF